MPSQPLAERLRPRTLDEYIGQKHLVGKTLSGFGAAYHWSCFISFQPNILFEEFRFCLGLFWALRILSFFSPALAERRDLHQVKPQIKQARTASFRRTTITR